MTCEVRAEILSGRSGYLVNSFCGDTGTAADTIPKIGRLGKLRKKEFSLFPPFFCLSKYVPKQKPPIVARGSEAVLNNKILIIS